MDIFAKHCPTIKWTARANIIISLSFSIFQPFHVFCCHQNCWYSTLTCARLQVYNLFVLVKLGANTRQFFNVFQLASRFHSFYSQQVCARIIIPPVTRHYFPFLFYGWKECCRCFSYLLHYNCPFSTCLHTHTSFPVDLLAERMLLLRMFSLWNKTANK
jgi:hypothetical protein